MGDRLNVSVWKDSCMSSGDEWRKNNFVLVVGEQGSRVGGVKSDKFLSDFTL